MPVQGSGCVAWRWRFLQRRGCIWLAGCDRIFSPLQSRGGSGASRSDLGSDSAMELLDVLTVRHGEERRTIELYQGDLTDLLPEEAVDILVVSAFPNNYLPTSRSLMG